MASGERLHDEDLELLALGRLSPREAEALQKHIRGCSTCALRVADALTFAKKLAQLQAELDPDTPRKGE